MNITVILCTYNRCHALPCALESLVAQNLPSTVEWEVIVVDNNSSDQTRRVVEDYIARYPGRFRYLFEGHQGLSRARNSGIRAARGEVIAFLDDDVSADANWLWSLTTPLLRGHWAGAGGRIAPQEGFEPPDWLTLGGALDLGGALALFNLGNGACELKRAPFGTNMAYRREVFERYGMFRVDLGRCGSNLISGEETEFGDRVMSAGEHLHYEPSAIVHHPVPKERLNKKYFRRWWFDFGRTRIIERGSRVPVRGIPRECFSILRLLFHLLPIRIWKWASTLETKRRFYLKCQVWLTVGELVENYRVARFLKRVPAALQTESIKEG